MRKSTSYTQRFTEAKKKRYQEEQDYIAKHNLFEKVIHPRQHPEYFEIEKDGEKPVKN